MNMLVVSYYQNIEIQSSNLRNVPHMSYTEIDFIGLTM